MVPCRLSTEDFRKGFECRRQRRVCVPRSQSGRTPLLRSSRGSEIIAQRCARMISLQAEGSFSCFIGIKDTRSRKQLKQNQKEHQRYPETSRPYKNTIHLKP